MSTETVDLRYSEIDNWPVADVMSAIWESQLSAVASVQNALPEITAATENAAGALGSNGRIIYVGAGTSIRVAVQDGSELPPTFNWPLDRLAFVIAGGERALIESREGAEDDVTDGEAQIDQLNLTSADVVIGLAASGTTPFTVAAIKRATDEQAVTIALANNANAPLLSAARHPIHLPTGGEVVAGSTRMKAGTSQKVVLNMLSTGIMIRLGHVYKGLMVDMCSSNKKLEKRAVNMVGHIAGCSDEVSKRSMRLAGGDVKLASLVAMGCKETSARTALERANNNLRMAIESLANDVVG